MASRILFRTSSQQLKNEREKEDLKSIQGKKGERAESSALPLEVRTENKPASKVFTYDTGRVVFSPMFQQ